MGTPVLLQEILPEDRHLTLSPLGEFMLSASLREIMLLGYNPQEMILPPALSPYAYRMSLIA
jgi:hypothetical protein